MALVDSLQSQNIVIGHRKARITPSKTEPIEVIVLTRSEYMAGYVLGIFVNYNQYEEEYLPPGSPKLSTLEEFMEAAKPDGWQFMIADNINKLGEFLLGLLDTETKNYGKGTPTEGC